MTSLCPEDLNNMTETCNSPALSERDRSTVYLIIEHYGRGIKNGAGTTIPHVNSMNKALPMVVIIARPRTTRAGRPSADQARPCAYRNPLDRKGKTLRTRVDIGSLLME